MHCWRRYPYLLAPFFIFLCPFSHYSVVSSFHLFIYLFIYLISFTPSLCCSTKNLICHMNDQNRNGEWILKIYPQTKGYFCPSFLYQYFFNFCHLSLLQKIFTGKTKSADRCVFEMSGHQLHNIAKGVHLCFTFTRIQWTRNRLLNKGVVQWYCCLTARRSNWVASTTYVGGSCMFSLCPGTPASSHSPMQLVGLGYMMTLNCP